MGQINENFWNNKNRFIKTLASILFLFKIKKKNSIIFSRPKEAQKQIKNLDRKVKKSIDLAYSRIFKFHSKQKVKNIFYKDNKSLNFDKNYNFVIE